MLKHCYHALLFNLDVITVMEDDIEILEKSAKLWPKAMEELPQEDWDMLFPGNCLNMQGAPQNGRHISKQLGG